MAKVSETDIAEIKALQAAVSGLMSQFGELHAQKWLIKQQIIKAEDMMKQLNDKQTTLLQRLQETYGIGTVNMETGEFVPSTPTE